MSIPFKALLVTALAENQYDLTDEKIAQLVCYLELLTTWNRAYNLTAITDPREMVYLHIIDSLSIAPYIIGPDLMDIGAGAGLPSIPLAILAPEQRWVCVDKNSKKTRFITQAIAELALTNAKAVHARGEIFKFARGFDSIISRAFGSLSLFIASTLHLLKPDGILIAMKGKCPHEELQELAETRQRAMTTEIIPLAIKGIAVERHVIRLQRVKQDSTQ